MTPALLIVSVDRDRDRYRNLLLLADEQWDMVERYLYRGDMYVALERDDPERAADEGHILTLANDADPGISAGAAPAVGCMIVTDEGVDERGLRIAEVKSLAVDPAHQRSGVGRALLEFAAQHATREYDILRVGTGDSALTVPFYEACGFTRSHVLPNFFIENYDHPIVEAGVQLKDMVILERRL